MKSILGIAVMSASLALSACGAVDAVIDCGAICSRYSSCFNTAYDVGACESRCRSSSANNTEFRRQADICSACMNNISCTATLFSCGVQCSSVVP